MLEGRPCLKKLHPNQSKEENRCGLITDSLGVPGKSLCTHEEQYFFFRMIGQKDQFLCGKEKADVFRSQNSGSIVQELRFFDQHIFELCQKQHLSKQVLMPDKAVNRSKCREHIEARFQVGNDSTCLAVLIQMKNRFSGDAYYFCPLLFAKVIKSHTHFVPQARNNVINALLQLQTGLAVAPGPKHSPLGKKAPGKLTTADKHYKLYTFMELPANNNDCSEHLWASYNVCQLLHAIRMIAMSPQFPGAVKNASAIKCHPNALPCQDLHVISAFQEYVKETTFVIKSSNYLPEYFQNHTATEISKKLFSKS